jgi:hypothetical protein
VSDKRDSPLFMRVLSLFSTRLHGILRSWFLLPFLILTGSILKR